MGVWMMKSEGVDAEEADDDALDDGSLFVMQERDDSEQLVRELMRKLKKLQEEQSSAEQSLKVMHVTATHASLFCQ